MQIGRTIWMLLILGVAIVDFSVVGALGQSVPIPKISSIASSNTNRLTFTVACQNSYGLTSAPSAAVDIPWTNRTVTVTIAWDRSPSVTNMVITNYTLLQGINGNITNSVNRGTNLTGAVTIAKPPAPPTVITMQLYKASSPLGQWTLWTNWPGLTITNPTANQYWKLGVRR